MSITISDKNNIVKLLNQLENHEVLSLASTITGGLLKKKIQTLEDAVKAIIIYSADVPSILRRKIFTKEILLSYLHEEKVAVELPITKNKLINLIVHLWGASKDEIIPNNSDQSIDTNETCDEENENNVKLLSLRFSQWFYNLLNANQLTEDHFFPDATLDVQMLSLENSLTFHYANARDSSCNLMQIKNSNYLFFNLNVFNNGVKGEMDPHGLVLVGAAGSLHSKNSCVGVFEQIFALARDPLAENNWKIKRTQLILKSSCGNAQALEECDMKEICPS